jgi:hypothetical protein
MLLRPFVFLTAFAIGSVLVLLLQVDAVTDTDLVDVESHEVIVAPILDTGALELDGSPEPEFAKPSPPSPDGAYFPIKERGFEEDTALVMSFFDWGNSGSIKIRNKFIDSDVSVDKSGKVRMETNKSRGSYYVFEGKFLKNGFETRFEDGDTVLTGTLSKYRAGKKVSSLTSEYLFASEVCAWNSNNQPPGGFVDSQYP